MKEEVRRELDEFLKEMRKRYRYVFVDNPFEEAVKFVRQLYEQGKKFIIERIMRYNMSMVLNEEEYEKYGNALLRFARYSGTNTFGDHVFDFFVSGMAVYVNAEWNYSLEYESRVMFIEKCINKEMFEVLRKVYVLGELGWRE